MKKYTVRKMICAMLALIMVLSMAACAKQEPAPAPVAEEPASTPVVEEPVVVEPEVAPIAELLDISNHPGAPANVPSHLEVDWNARYTFAELEAQLEALNETYPDISELYSIGASWEERELWCMEITNEASDAEGKTPIAIIANIHGGERESASSAMYTAWWMLLNSEDDYVKGLLDHYILYVIPVMNPDGYEQSFINNNRPNMHPVDANGDGRPFSDPYTDLNGDGYISNLYRGTAEDEPSRKLASFGMESPDWDQNGILGDDPHSSGIDMNRTFNYMFNRCDIDSEVTIGANSWSSSGKGNYMPATEPEVEAVQRFLYATTPYALITAHTGIQCVLYPWCYRPYDEALDGESDIPFMAETSAAMAGAYQDYTGRGFYYKSSYEDYPTSAELIDWAYGRLGIHAYTVEVYNGGTSGNIEDCKWENELPEATWEFYSQEDIQNVLGLDPTAITDSKGVGLAENEGLWFYTSSSAQMVDKAPEDQQTMVEGFLECALVMIHSEPTGEGPEAPLYYK